jgi:hypothetical protein
LPAGQSLVAMMAFHLATPRYFVDIGRIPDLNRIAIGPDGVRLGSLVRQAFRNLLKIRAETIDGMAEPRPEEYLDVVLRTRLGQGPMRLRRPAQMFLLQ